MNDIELESLVGAHWLSGAYFDAKPNGNQVLYFTLDGQHYEAEEDPDDGYRSGLGELRTSEVAPENTFCEVRVIARMDDNKNNDVLQIVNADTGNIILEIGTADTHDYYPGFVGYFSPENL